MMSRRWIHYPSQSAGDGTQFENRASKKTHTVKYSCFNKKSVGVVGKCSDKVKKQKIVS